MNGDVEIFTKRVSEYLTVTPLHNATGTPAVTVPRIGRVANSDGLLQHL